MNRATNQRLWFSILCGGCMVFSQTLRADGSADVAQPQACQWRAEHRIIDLHQHVGGTPEHLARAVKIMDAVGLGIAVNLSGGAVTSPKAGEPSEFERNKRMADELFPGRFLHYMNLDYRDWDQPDFPARAVKQIEEGHRLGAAGFKENKRLGLYLRDGKGQLIKVDDPKLDPLWERCGELNLPVSIHVADPRAFWLPFDDRNERWNELKDHRNGWFGDPDKFPSWKDLLDALDRVIARHPKTTFVCVHFGNNAEELDWVDQALGRRPNMMIDLAARIPELGRHDPEAVRRFFVKHQDRILFATDLMVRERLVLGSGGDGPPPTDADAEIFFAKEWRWLETLDRDWEHMTPIQGDWKISSIGLPASVLRKIYFDNACKLLARSLPLPVARAARIEQDFAPDGDLAKPVWQKATPVQVEYAHADYTARPELSTAVRMLWSDKFLYLGYECPYTRLTFFDPPQFDKKRYDLDKSGVSLWDGDVVEAFINADPENIRHYSEYEVAPSNEQLDLMVVLPQKDFAWRSHYESAVKIDEKAGVWFCEMRIPLAAIGATKPAAGARWRLNLFRCDRAHQANLAWSPTLGATFHTPDKFGVLEFSP